jgi:hypothetical protein
MQFGVEQAVKVRADRLIRGGQPGGEGGLGMSRHARRAEQIADGGPLPDQPLKAGPLGGRVGGVQPLKGVQPGIDHWKTAGVQDAEQPGAVRGPGGEESSFTDRVRAVHRPGQLGRGRGRGQLVTRGLIPEPRGGTGAHDADSRHADHDQSEPDAQDYERTGCSSGKRSH